MITSAWPVTSGTTLPTRRTRRLRPPTGWSAAGPLASIAQAVAMLPLRDGAPDLQVFLTMMGFEPDLVPMAQDRREQQGPGRWVKWRGTREPTSLPGNLRHPA